ncbi:MAG: Fic family protein [Bacteroidales bacterium]|jgi:Fic family protein|nr:Fic family protein [Bacteroidales bacterium]
MVANFKHTDLRLVDPPFGSKLNTLVLELDYLRKKPIRGTTHPLIFFQLKKIFHLLESIGSARIEGNRTTLSEYIERKIEGSKTKDERFLEIENNEKALIFIEENIDNYKIDRAFLSQIHKIITKNLDFPPHGEGSMNPGDYRKSNIVIGGSSHIPPDFFEVNFYMEELFNFINKSDPPQYDLLKTAIAHHRFVWIHPFDNGNGRTVRLLTYAMLIKYGFKVHKGSRIINPTAVFCNSREKYYYYLSIADKGDDKSLLTWCEYVLDGLKNELNKIDNLLDYEFLSAKILSPAIDFALERKYITQNEYKVLQITIKKQVIQASDLKQIFPGKISAEISRIIRKLIDKNMLQPTKDQSRKYVLNFENNYLLRSIIEMLDKEKFLPIPIDK